MSEEVIEGVIEIPESLLNQSQPLRVESTEFAVFNTARCTQSRLWLADMPKELLNRILGYLGKYSLKYDVTLYSFVILGNHYHLVAKFNKPNRSQFQRDFNSRIADGVRMFVGEFDSGPLFHRRFSSEALPLHEDIEDRFFYCALQDVNAGLTKNPLKHQGYNSAKHAIEGIEREYPVVEWGKYKAAKRKSPRVSQDKYTTWYKLKFERLPGYEEMSKEEYKSYMLKELHSRAEQVIEEREREGKGFVPEGKFVKPKVGSKPKTTKLSERDSHRPLVLTKCIETKNKFLDWYFSIYYEFKRACARYLKGEKDVEFPPGTHKPPCYRNACCAYDFWGCSA